jgi:DNA-binding response OmpR family regulator
MSLFEPTVAIISTDPDLAPELCARLASRNCRVILVTSIERLAEHVRETEVHVVVVDLDMTGGECLHLLQDLKGLNRHLGLIVVAGRCSQEDEIYLRSNGVLYLAFKPVEPGHLAEIVRQSARNVARKRLY